MSPSQMSKPRYALKKSTGNVVQVKTVNKTTGTGTKRVFSNGANVKKGMKTYSSMSKAKKVHTSVAKK